MRISQRTLDRLLTWVVLGLIRSLRILPYRKRVAFMGKVASRFIGPLAGYRKRVFDNLALVAPDVSQKDAREIFRASADNLGRNVAEIFYWDAFLKSVKDTPFIGEGWPEVSQAFEAGSPVIFISGHFGNLNALRAKSASMGQKIVGIYQPLENESLNDPYVEAMQKISPMVPRDASGMRAFMKELKQGRSVALLHDQALPNGVPLEFFGKPAKTVLTPAELALRFNALLVPAYGIRRNDGISFELIVEKPIPHSTPEEMMQQANDSLEARVREHMGQWLWMHRRWK